MYVLFKMNRKKKDKGIRFLNLTAVYWSETLEEVQDAMSNYIAEGCPVDNLVIFKHIESVVSIGIRVKDDEV